MTQAAYSGAGSGVARHLTVITSGPNIIVWIDNTKVIEYSSATFGQANTKVGIRLGKQGTLPGTPTLNNLSVPKFQTAWGTIGGQGYFMAYPLGATPGGASLPLAIYHHGASETHYNLLGLKPKEPVIAALVGAGYMVITSNANGDNWGNSAGLTSVKALYDAQVASGWTFTKVVHIGQSMGGLAGLLCLADATNWPSASGFYGICPVCSLSDVYANGFSSAIETAYGFSGSSNYATATAGHDPLLLSNSLFAGKRLRFCASPSDTVVGKAANSDAMIAHVAGTATEASLIQHVGNHGDPTEFKVEDVVAFCNRC